MKKTLFFFFLLVSVLAVQAQAPASEPSGKADKVELETFTVGEITVNLPSNIAYKEELSHPELGGPFIFLTPDKSLFFSLSYFKYGEEFSQDERLKGEALEVNFEVTQSHIMYLKISQDKFMSIAGTDRMAIGVCPILPEENIGIVVFSFVNDESAETDVPLFTLLSIREYVKKDETLP